MNNLDFLNESDVSKIVDTFKEPVFGVSQEEAANQYDVLKHDIFDESIRPNKIVTKDTGQIDGDGAVVTVKESVPVCRIGLPIQSQIVEQRIGFMLSIPIDYNMTYTEDGAKALVDASLSIISKNRMKYKDKDVLRRQMSEMQCAELWYLVPTGGEPKFELKCKILSPSLGDTLCPVYDNYGDMIAFGRKYKIKEDDKDIEYFDVYTKDFNYFYVNRDGWKLDTMVDGETVFPNPSPNPARKIPIVYHSQYYPEWYPSQKIIDRLEVSISNHADMNDYFGSPILAVAGEILGFASKGEQGKILELAEEAKANYLSLTTPPESIRLEQAQLREFAFALANTADISFDKVKGIGNLSAVALNLLFISSTMAAKTKEETFAIGLQRRINIIMAFIGNVIDTKLAKYIPMVNVDPKINVYAPSDVNETIKMLGQAYIDKVMSLDAVVEQNPLIIDKEKEKELLKAEIEITKKM